MNIIIVNDDPFGNQFRVADLNAGNREIFNGYIEAHGERSITCQANDSQEAHIMTFQDNNDGIGRSFLKEGQRVIL